MSAGSRTSRKSRMWSGEMKPIEPPTSPCRVRCRIAFGLVEALGQPEVGELDAGAVGGAHHQDSEGLTSRCT